MQQKTKSPFFYTRLTIFVLMAGVILTLLRVDSQEKTAMIEHAQKKSDDLALSILGYAKKQKNGYGYAHSFVGGALIEAGVIDSFGDTYNPENINVKVIYVDDKNYTVTVMYPVKTALVPQPSNSVPADISEAFNKLDRDAVFVTDKGLSMLTSHYETFSTTSVSAKNKEQLQI